jgi:hypothetical protein
MMLIYAITRHYAITLSPLRYYRFVTPFRFHAITPCHAITPLLLSLLTCHYPLQLLMLLPLLILLLIADIISAY